MTGRDVLRMAADNLAAHKLRSALTLLGVVFGVGAVIAMLAIGAGAEAQALQSGATPTTPLPLMAAATVPAQCVPWP